MKKIILTLIAAVAMTTAVAQTGNADKREHKRMDPKEMVEKRTKEMAEKYALSTEQTAKLKALNEKYMGKRGPRPEGRGNKARVLNLLRTRIHRLATADSTRAVHVVVFPT